MRQKKHFPDWIKRQLDIPEEALPGGFGLALSGQRELTVRGCRRILTYGPDCIRLRLGKLTLVVEGEGLLCTVFGAENVKIEGHIHALRFEKGVGHAD